jgi:uncharacterized protein (UPF0262 family)
MDGSSEKRNRICKIDLDEQLRIRRNADIEHERTVAIFDLLEENTFALLGDQPGPYHLTLSIEDTRLAFDVKSETGAALERLALPLSPFRGVIKDYFTVCESYYDAIKRLSPSQIEALDMGRRAVHNEGSQLLRERLEGKIEMDHNTARRLFTLICVLHIRA